jgi:hypothetical protein
VGLFDTLLGRTKSVAPVLDNIFALPNAAVTLATSLDLVPSGHAGLCFKDAIGEQSIAANAEVRGLLALDSDTSLRVIKDDLGFTWLVVDDPDLGNQVTKIHAANTTMVEHGLGANLLCAVFGFVPQTPPGDGDVRLVYLLKRGTFYPFAPRDGERRDNELELRVKSFLASEVSLETDLSRWMALWGLPVA